MENVEQGIAGQPSSLTTCNSKSATQTLSGYTEGSQQSSEKLRSLGGEVHLSSLASPNSLQSVTDTAPDVLDENELLPILGVKAEPVETLSIASPPVNQSTTDASLDHLDVSELLPKAEPVETRSISSQTSLQSCEARPH